VPTPSSPTDPPKTQLRAPAEPQWLEHPTLCGLRGRLQLAYDCWTLLELPDGTHLTAQPTGSTAMSCLIF